MSKPLRGFTMAEMVTTILIIGIVGAIALPRLADSVCCVQLDGVAERLRCDLEMARRHAIHRGRSTTVVFDDANASYACAEIVDSESTGGSLQVSLPTAHGINLAMTLDFDPAAGIRFDPEGQLFVQRLDGSVDNVADVELRSSSQRLMIQIRPRLSLITSTMEPL